MGENCNLTLVLKGSSQLRYGGIRVPESSAFKCCGDGDLWIFIDSGGYYAIGNDKDSKHGELIFEQGVTIESHASVGVGIGSGLGGKINIRRGKFTISMKGTYIGVGIGALNAPADMDLFACDITMDLGPEHCVAIGSLESDCRITLMHSAINCFLSGSEIVGMGTLSGKKASVTVSEASVMINIAADRCSSIAALDGNTEFVLSKAGFHITVKGDNALAIGGYGEYTGVSVFNSDFSVTLVTHADYMRNISTDGVKIEGGRTRISVNDEIVVNE